PTAWADAGRGSRFRGGHPAVSRGGVGLPAEPGPGVDAVPGGRAEGGEGMIPTARTLLLHRILRVLPVGRSTTLVREQGHVCTYLYCDSDTCDMNLKPIHLEVLREVQRRQAEVDSRPEVPHSRQHDLLLARLRLEEERTDGPRLSVPEWFGVEP